jgi:hypothetical protein
LRTLFLSPWIRLVVLVLTGLAPIWLNAAYPPLQPLVDAAAEGAVLTPEPGIYAGPRGGGQAMTIDGRIRW